MVVKEIKKIEVNEAIELENIADLLGDLNTLRFNLLSRLDPFLRFQVQKRGITVIQNIYTGFEFN